MNYIDVIIIIGIIGGIISIIGQSIFLKLRKKSNLHEQIGISVSIIGVAMIIITAFSGFAITLSYYTALSLPYEYQSACDTVNETTKLLMRYDNIGNGSFNSIGYGLEAQQLKNQLKDAIQTKNELRAKILSWLHDPMAVYKDILLERLPANFQ